MPQGNSWLKIAHCMQMAWKCYEFKYLATFMGIIDVLSMYKSIDIRFYRFLFIFTYFYSFLLLFLPKTYDTVFPVHNMEFPDICHPNTIHINTVNLLIKLLCSAKSHDSHQIFSVVNLYLNQHVVNSFFLFKLNWRKNWKEISARLHQHPLHIHVTD